MQTLAKAKIFIVDDHALLRQGLKRLINQEEDMIFAGEAVDAYGAIQGIASIMPDLVLMDISLQGTNGIDLTKHLLAKEPNLPVLVVSMHDESIYADRALLAGAKGYLMKRELADQVIVAIRRVLSGDIYLSARWKEKTLHQFT